MDADSISQQPQLQPGGSKPGAGSGGGASNGAGRGYYNDSSASQVLLVQQGGGARPASPGVTSAAELEAELSALRQARAEYQRSITASQVGRAGGPLVGVPACVLGMWDAAAARVCRSWAGSGGGKAREGAGGRGYSRAGGGGGKARAYASVGTRRQTPQG